MCHCQEFKHLVIYVGENPSEIDNMRTNQFKLNDYKQTETASVFHSDRLLITKILGIYLKNVNTSALVATTASLDELIS